MNANVSPADRRMRRAGRLLVIAVAMTAASCGTSRDEPPPSTANMPTERMVGTVEVVREEVGFVLIRVRPGFGLPAGSLLEVRPEGRDMIPLSVSPERGRNLVVADFAGGPPQVGDPVYQVLGPASAPGTAEPSDFVEMPPPEPLGTY